MRPCNCGKKSQTLDSENAVRYYKEEMPSKTEYSATLTKLTALLKRKQMTAKAIAAALGCSKPVVYQQIRDLKKLGIKFNVERVRESVTGPASTAYKIR